MINEFKKTLGVSKKYFGAPKCKVYDDSFIGGGGSQLGVVLSGDTVETIFRLSDTKKRIAALNFADAVDIGGMVWEGALTQEECLCRSSNLYLGLELAIEFYDKNNYYTGGNKIVYNKEVKFFRDSELEWVKEPVSVDIISCAAPRYEVAKSVDVKRKMRGIIEVAKDNEVDILILGRWGCGAFGNDWNVFKKLWGEIFEECGVILYEDMEVG